MIARRFEEAGLSGLHITAGVGPDFDWAVDPIYAAPARKAFLAEAIKKAVTIPVITVGVIREPKVAEEILAKGQADFVAVGRGLLADPDWPVKAASGRAEDIRRCFSCNHCDGVRNPAGQAIRCVVNSELGRGKDGDQIKPAADRKRVVVIGGGPAGMKAASVAAARGHDVTLFEAAPELGGQLRIAACAPGKDKIQWLLGVLTDELASSGAKIELNIRISGESMDSVGQLSPDVVVLASGAEPLVPSIPGVGQANVSTAWSILRGDRVLGEKRVAVIGGNATGCETAIYLALEDSGRDVVIIEQLGELAVDAEQFARAYLRREIDETPNLRLELGQRATGITPAGVEVVDKGGVVRCIDGDEIVLAVGVSPVRDLADRLAELGLNVEVIGDSGGGRSIVAAIEEGYVFGATV